MSRVRLSFRRTPPLTNHESSVGAGRALSANLRVGELAGGLIGYTLVKLQCDGACAAPRGIGALTGALLAAGGMSVVAVLVLRAVGEWRQIEQRESSGRS